VIISPENLFLKRENNKQFLVSSKHIYSWWLFHRKNYFKERRNAMRNILRTYYKNITIIGLRLRLTFGFE